MGSKWFCYLKKMQYSSSRCQVQSIPRQACEAEASVSTRVDMLLLRDTFSNEDDEL